MIRRGADGHSVSLRLLDDSLGLPLEARAGRVDQQSALNAQPLDLRAIEATATTDAGMPGFSAKATRVCACGSDAAADCQNVKCNREPVAYIQVETLVETSPFLRYPGMTVPLKIHERALVRIE